VSAAAIKRLARELLAEQRKPNDLDTPDEKTAREARIATALALACVAPTRGYSRAFTPPGSAPRVQLMIDRVPPTLMSAIRAKATRDGTSVRALVLGMLTEWLATQPATIEGSTTKAKAV
jgi:hypothetical protein